jgi:aldose 1-epimerase
MTLHEISSGDHTIVLDLAAGARAVSWSFEGHELLVGSNPHPLDCGMYVMAPWVGRNSENTVRWNDRDHVFPTNSGQWAVHGSAYQTDIASVSSEILSQSERLVITQNLDQWVEKLVMQTSWQVFSDRLETSVTLRSHSGAAFPASVGWHPWFRKEIPALGQLKYHAGKAQRYLREGEIDTDAHCEFRPEDGPFDSTLKVLGQKIDLSWGDQLGLTITNSSPWFVLYDQPAHATCIEPQSAPPNAFSRAELNDWVVTEPDRELELVNTWLFNTS